MTTTPTMSESSDGTSSPTDVSANVEEIPRASKEAFIEGEQELVCQDAFEATNYTRGCHFSPDGQCVLLNSADNTLRLYELPSSSSSLTTLRPCLKMSSNESVYDLKWYPMMTSSNVDTCCFVTTAMQQPIHLHDAYYGHIRASYRCFDHLDELVSARSLSFDCRGHRLIAGLKNQLRVFDVSRPGRDCDKVVTWSKSDRSDGQRGILSCLDMSPVLGDILAAGTFEKSLGIYNLNQASPLLCLLEGQKGGLTHVKFTSDGSKVLAGARKDDEILVWDLRNPGTLFCVLGREARTNQTIFFDTHSIHSDLVVSACSDGQVMTYDLTNALNSDQVTKAHRNFKASNECLNGLSLHPTLPMMATSSGQRHVCVDNDEDDKENNEENKWESKLSLWHLARKTTVQKPNDE